MEFSDYNEVVRAWTNEVLASRGIDAERTLKCCQDIEQYATQKQDAKLLGFAYYYSGETYYLLNDGENMFRYIMRAISYLDQSGQWELVAEAYNLMAITSLNRGNAPIAMDYYLTGLSYCRKYGLPEAENIINMNLGNLYFINGQYTDAQKYFEEAYRYAKGSAVMSNNHSIMAGIQVNLGMCYLEQDKTKQAKECLDHMEGTFWEELNKTERVYVYCFRTHYYHRTGRVTLRDECVRKIIENVDEDMAVMDVFDDFYKLCELLLEIDEDDAFWEIINILERLAKRAKIINMQCRLISLKIKYYREHRDNAGYLQAAGLYYELAELMEKENRYMVANMLSVRNSLEQANEKRRELEKEKVRLQKKSETDALTQLANRFRLHDHAETVYERCLLNETTYAVEILDIDYFKQYNDNYGHQAGDECIVAIAKELKKMESDQIFCARYGGDEFVVIYEGMTQEEVIRETEGIRERVMTLAIEHLYSPALPLVSVSQGICFDIPAEDNKNWDFLHAADLMLYRVKKESRNNISVGNLAGEILHKGNP